MYIFFALLNEILGHTTRNKGKGLVYDATHVVISSLLKVERVLICVVEISLHAVAVEVNRM